jgi:hypothetical protein
MGRQDLLTVTEFADTIYMSNVGASDREISADTKLVITVIAVHIDPG